ncbi:MAG: glycine zipper 2TM domain-containing protein [Pseudomonadota bacterium]|nr:glycine zipper 2TM domain-containing protein [Pseudomonadota bacterium]
MKHKKSILTVVVASSVLFGCDGNGLSNEQGGAVIGATLGGIAGSKVGDGSGQTAATIAGTVGGAYVGSKLGASVDETEKNK